MGPIKFWGYAQSLRLSPNVPQQALRDYLAAGQADVDIAMERLSSVLRRLIHSAANRRGIDDMEDFEEDCLLAIWFKIQSIKVGNSETQIDNLGAFVRQAVRNRYCDAVRRKRPKWYNLKIELTELLTGRANIQGFAVWEHPGTGEKMCGFKDWEWSSRSSSAECLHLLRRVDDFKRKFLASREPQELPTYELVSAVLNYTGGPVEIDTLTNCLLELIQSRNVEVVSVDTQQSDDADQTTSQEWILSSDVDVEKQVVDASWFAQVAQWFWREFSALSVMQRRVMIYGMTNEQVAAICAVVGFSEVACGLEVSAQHLRDILESLPLPDAVTAQETGQSPKSVPGIRFKAWVRIRKHSQKSSISMQ